MAFIRKIQEATTGSKTPSRNSAPDSPAPDDEKSELDESSHKLTTKDYITIVINLLEHRDELKNLDEIAKFIKKIVKQVTGLNSGLKDELKLLYPEERRKAHGQKNIEKFIADFSKFLEHLNALAKPKKKIKISDAVKGLVMELNNLIDQFGLLNLDIMLKQYLPDSYDQVKQQMLFTVSDYMKKWLVQIEGDAKSAYETFGDKFDHLTSEQIKALPRAAQHPILLGMETALTFYKEFILVLDKIELQFGFREGALFEILSQKTVAVNEQTPEKKSTPPKKKPADYTKKIIEQFEKLSRKYQEIIVGAGYQPIELYPYTYSKIEARAELAKKITEDLEAKKTAYAALKKDLGIEIDAIITQRNIGEKFNIFEFIARTSDNSIIKITNPNRKVSLILPVEIKTAEHASKIQGALHHSYSGLKRLLKDKSQDKLSQEDITAILAPHKKSLEAISAYEFCLREKERVDDIVKKQTVSSENQKPRDFKLMDTTRALINKASEIAESAKPFLNKESEERKKIDKIVSRLANVQKSIEDIYDPCFISHVKKQFEGEKEAQKSKSLLANNDNNGQNEVKQPLPGLERKQSTLELNTPYFNYAHQLLIATLRISDSLGIILELIEPGNHLSVENSPGEALVNDMQRCKFIVDHYLKATAAYKRFKEEIKMQADNKQDAPVLDEKKHEVKISVAPTQSKKTVRASFKSALKSVKSYGSYVVTLFSKTPRHNTDEAKNAAAEPLLISDDQSVDAKESADEKAQTIVQTGLVADLKSIAYQKYESILTTVQSNIASLMHQSPAQISLQIGNITLSPDSDPNILLHDIAKDLKKIGLVVAASYSNFMKPPTKFTHLKTSLSHPQIIFRLGENLDKLADIIISNHIALPDQVLSNLNQLMKHLIVLIDDYEIRYFLKEGVILKLLKDQNLDLEKFINAINGKLNEHSLKFSQDNCYPYPQDVKENRKKLLEEKNTLVQEMASKRLQNSPELKRENNPDTNVPDINHTALVNELTLEIDRAKEKRFHWVWSRKKLESRITGLEACRKALKPDGYTMSDSARILMEPAWKFLLSTDGKLMDRLKKMEEQVPKSHKIISAPKNKNKPAIDVRHPIIIKINERLEQLTKSYQSSNNLKKQTLLKTLKSNMLDHQMSFKQALQAAKWKHFKDAYLLYDGKTGAMIRELEMEYINVKKLKKRIDRQIYQLQKNTSGFFKPSPEKVQQDIALLDTLKTNHHMQLSKQNEKSLTQIAPDLMRTLSHLRKTRS